MTASRTRILIWAGLYRPYIGGVEVRLSSLLPALARQGFDISVVTSHFALDLPDQELIDGVTIYRLRLQEALAERRPDALFQMRQHVGRLRQQISPHLVHVNLLNSGIYFHLQTMKLHPAPTLVEIPLSILEEPTGPDTWRGRALRTATWITAPSAAALADVWQVAPETIAHSSVIPNSLPQPALAPAPLPVHEPCILCLGRIEAEKGFDVAIQAFGLIAKRYPRSRLVIAGDGQELKKLKIQAAELGITLRIDFVGWLHPEYVPEFINTSTMVVMPSRWREAFGLVALQAAQMGRPVVATSTGGLPEVVIDGVTGLLVPIDDAVAMADAMTRLLDDPRLAIDMGQRARHRAQTVFAWDQYVAAYGSLYRTLIAGAA